MRLRTLVVVGAAADAAIATRTVYQPAGLGDGRGWEACWRGTVAADQPLCVYGVNRESQFCSAGGLFRCWPLQAGAAGDFKRGGFTGDITASVDHLPYTRTSTQHRQCHN